MDKAQAMKVMAESHRVTVEELEKEIERYREALIKIKLGSESDVIHYSTRLKSINKIAVEALEVRDENNRRVRRKIQGN